VSATLEHGILRLEVPKAEAVKPRKIAIQLGQPEERTLEAGK
jgi:HSP20 family protein